MRNLRIECLRVLEMNLRGYHILNVGSGNLLSVNQIVNTIRAEIAPLFDVQYHSGNNLDVSSFKLDLHKMKELVGNFVCVPFEEGLKRTYDWYQSKLFGQIFRQSANSVLKSKNPNL